MKHARGIGLGTWLVALAVILGTAGGCATKGFVRKNVTEVRDDMTRMEQRLQEQNDRTAALAGDAKSQADLALAEVGDARDLALGRADFREAARYRVQFAFDSSTLDASARSTLDEAANQIEANRHYVVNVLGFADPTGPEAYNIELGRRRAEAVVRHLLDRRPADMARFQAISFGEVPPSFEAAALGEGAARRQVLVVLLERTPLEHQDQLTGR